MGAASAKRSAYRVSVPVHATRDAEVIRVPRRRSAGESKPVVPGGNRGRSRDLWRSAASIGHLHAARRLHSLGTDGGGILPGTRTDGLLADTEPRRVGGALLLPVSLLRRGRGRALER